MGMHADGIEVLPIGREIITVKQLLDTGLNMMIQSIPRIETMYNFRCHSSVHGGTIPCLW
jgi:hypothetical protein